MLCAEERSDTDSLSAPFVVADDDIADVVEDPLDSVDASGVCFKVGHDWESDSLPKVHQRKRINLVKIAHRIILFAKWC